MDYTTLLRDVTPDGVATLTINRPQALNSFDATMLKEFAAVWHELQFDARVRAIVLRAAPGRAFSTGADVRAALTDPIVDFSRPFEQEDPGTFLGPKSRRCWKPVVTAIHGLCCAGAFYWVNEGDIVLCSEDAQFFDPHVTYGMVAAVEPAGLMQRIPYGEVARIMLMGNDERVSAATALRIGLVSEVLATPEALWERAHQLAARIATKPTMATQGTTRAMWEAKNLPRDAALTQAFNMPLLGNPIAEPDVDRDAVMRTAKQFEVR